MSASTKRSHPDRDDSDRDESGRLRSLLVSVDFTAISDRVIARVALLPLDEGARVTLLHVVPDDLPPRALARAERDAKRLVQSEARHLVRALPKSVTVEAVVKIGAVAAEIVACASAVEAELIVMGRGGSRALKDVFLGSTAERVIRRGQLPVLAVRLAARSEYARPLVALDLDQAATHVLVMMLRLIAPPRPRVTVLHAFDTPYRGVVYPSLSEEDAQEWTLEHEHKARLKLGKAMASALARAKVRPEDAPLWKTRMQPGSARLVIEKAVKKTESDLLVLGTRGYSGVAHVLLGTVAGDVLREVACDVLIVPSPKRAAR